MKLLLAGNWQWPQYEKACSDALSRLGVDVERFEWGRYFTGLSGRFQGKFAVPGPAQLRLNRDLIKRAETTKPNVTLVWRGTHLFPGTLRRLKKSTGSLLVSYNNDDPFGPQAHGQVPIHQRYYWFWYLKCIPLYDVNFVYRQINLDEIFKAGAKEAHVLMPYFIPALNHPVKLTPEELADYACDVVFVGHYEPDGREKYLRALVKAGLHVRLFGGKYWTRQVLGDVTDYFGKVRPANGDEYAKALAGAKMCLCFLSHMNRDTYTRRCFEVPACGRLLLSERTADLQRMYKENEEAVFFSSPDELVEKSLWLSNHPEEIQRIAQAGMRRVHADGHSVEDRMGEFLSIIDQHSAS